MTPVGSTERFWMHQFSTDPKGGDETSIQRDGGSEFSAAGSVTGGFRIHMGGRNGIFTYKVGPKTSYKWGYNSYK